MTELHEVKAKLAAREGVQGYAENCEALKARIAELEAAGAVEESGNDEDQ